MVKTFSLGMKSGVLDLELLDDEGNILYQAYSEGCIMTLSYNGYVNHMRMAIFNEHKKNPKRELSLRHSIRILNRNDYDGTIMYLNYLFDKNESPFKHLLNESKFHIEYDEEDRPLSFICEDIANTNLDGYVSLSVATRLPYESPGSMLLFKKAVEAGLPKHKALWLANAFCFSKDDVIVISPRAMGNHSIFNCCMHTNMLKVLDGIKFDKNTFLSNKDYSINKYFSHPNFHWKHSCASFLIKGDKYTGIFPIQWKRRNEYSTDKQTPFPFKKLIEAVKEAE